MRVLVIGARTGSLGGAICDEVRAEGGVASTAGISGEEYDLDLHFTPLLRVRNVLRAARPDHVVCTAGINTPESDQGNDPRDWYRWHFEANVIGPMRLLHEFAAWVTEDMDGGNRLIPLRHFVAISSNSATIPRTNSAAYCASKAALSQALRVKAREALGGDHGYLVYGYEPGLLTGTPMTRRTQKDFPGVPLHRMRGEVLAEGVPTEALAAYIVAGLRVPGAALNGATIRYDGGEV